MFSSSIYDHFSSVIRTPRAFFPPPVPWKRDRFVMISVIFARRKQRRPCFDNVLTSKYSRLLRLVVRGAHFVWSHPTTPCPDPPHHQRAYAPPPQLSPFLHCPAARARGEGELAAPLHGIECPNTDLSDAGVCSRVQMRALISSPPTSFSFMCACFHSRFP